MNENPEIRDRLNVNKSTYHNKRPCERFICFIRGAKWMKINQLNGPSLIHDTSTWLSQSIQSIIRVFYWLDMQKNLPWKCFRTAFGHYDLLSTSKLDACANVTTCCCAIYVCNISLPVLANWLESVRIKHWFPCGADGRAGGVRSRDYQIFWDG